MYFCEQTFLMKHTSEHTCETAIYHEQSPDLINDTISFIVLAIISHALPGTNVHWLNPCI